MSLAKHPSSTVQILGAEKAPKENSQNGFGEPQQKTNGMEKNHGLVNTPMVGSNCSGKKLVGKKERSW